MNSPQLEALIILNPKINACSNKPFKRQFIICTIFQYKYENPTLLFDKHSQASIHKIAKKTKEGFEIVQLTVAKAQNNFIMDGFDYSLHCMYDHLCHILSLTAVGNMF